jgi:hypothetical protein
MQGVSMERKFVRAAHYRGYAVTCGKRLAAHFQPGGAICAENDYIHEISCMVYIFVLSEQATTIILFTRQPGLP